MIKGVNREQIFKDGKLNLIEGEGLYKQELEFLFNIPKGTLFFGNDLGLDLEAYLFLSNNQAIFTLIKEQIEKAILSYKKVAIERLELLFEELEGRLTINLLLRPLNANRVIDFSFSI